ncbi:hypothetical protein TSO221_22315 [Azospirillum sp. TSO22-1]|nr:hypothetical protein TSO221_22315 [Azospirillum sp. TSO22-1]
MRIARARPLSAIGELVWNSLDADAEEVVVYFDRDQMGLKGIIVEDNGLGMTPTEAQEYFGKLGGSWKRPGARTKKHQRVLHGNQGQGRYKSLSIGRSVTWKLFFEDGNGISEFTVEILSTDPSQVRISDAQPSKHTATGCIVQIRDPHKQFKNLEGNESAQELTELLAIYLADYPDVKVVFAEKQLEVTNAIQKQFKLRVPDVMLPSGERAPESELRVLEWRHVDRRSLFICDARGFAVQQVSTKFQLKKHSFSAYLTSPYLDQLEQENRLALTDLDPLAELIIHVSKDTIKEHYEGEDKKEAARLIQEWKAAKIYPYEDAPKTTIEEAERKVFEIVAVKIHTAYTELTAAPKVAKALQLELLRHAIETGPNHLRDLLSKVIELPKREQDDLSKLLEETTLSSIIGAAKIVTDRLKFLRGLYQIVYEYEKHGRIKERRQLHRILAINPWIFGEEFMVSTDDRDLTAVLRAHKKHLDDDIVIDVPVKHIDQSTGIVDLMLSRLLRRHRADEVEHLVVELKRPGVDVGADEITQITKYASSIESDGRFAMRDGIVWHFWVISDKLDSYGAYEVKKDSTGRGLVRDTPTAKIYVKTWRQLIEECKARYQFIQEKLNFTANDEHAMRYLRKEHAALLDGVVVESDHSEAELLVGAVGDPAEN